MADFEESRIFTFDLGSILFYCNRATTGSFGDCQNQPSVPHHPYRHAREKCHKWHTEEGPDIAAPAKSFHKGEIIAFLLMSPIAIVLDIDHIESSTECS